MFHRFTVPTYAGGLRGGDDYLNNELSGTPALIADLRDEGTNAGSYFVNFGEFALSEAVNRGLAALAENTDYLDDQVVDIQASLNAVRTITTSDSLHSPNTDGTLIVNPGAPITLQLPDPADVEGKRAFILNGDGSLDGTNTCTLVRDNTEKINNLAADYVLDTPYGCWMILSDGTDWHVRFMPA